MINAFMQTSWSTPLSNSGNGFDFANMIEKKSMGGEPRFWPLVRPRRQFETLKT